MATPQPPTRGPLGAGRGGGDQPPGVGTAAASVRSDSPGQELSAADSGSRSGGLGLAFRRRRGRDDGGHRIRRCSGVREQAAGPAEAVAGGEGRAAADARLLLRLGLRAEMGELVEQPLPFGAFVFAFGAGRDRARAVADPTQRLLVVGSGGGGKETPQLREREHVAAFADRLLDAVELGAGL